MARGVHARRALCRAQPQAWCATWWWSTATASTAFEEIADIAGCDFHTVRGTRGAALAAGARPARGPWLMFISPGAVPDPGWADEAAQFIQTTKLAGASRAATFLRVSEAYAATSLSSGCAWSRRS